ncbi:MAG: flagellar biosynthetic protein FliQ [Candidatus Abyssobacteria bacterium SURF_17]|jgi:flagellar biosynthetic protein FliQ|uniref:Flagellar biosynthetic protein FliQ n=1 Tax=Candidatus Abyssobacteria bacterium SURF_17 TaxID=2093361 RepID=A0A419EY99_9BACT|nr:MAG: flagellar biosynthetic protein FliQ [Candidatus Abyssubacteria bacterium SURF_17]
MTPQGVVDIGREALMITLLISAPPLLAGLAVGLIISIFQAVTQIQEFTLTFIPKILAVFIATIIFLPWMLQVFLGYTTNLFIQIPILAK